MAQNNCVTIVAIADITEHFSHKKYGYTVKGIHLFTSESKHLNALLGLWKINKQSK